jgi:hypothetical protein
VATTPGRFGEVLMAGVPPQVTTEIVKVAERLEHEYAAAFEKLDGNIGHYWNRTSLNIEVLFGKGLGTGWSAHSRFARLSWWPFGHWIQTKPITDVERELRQEIETYLTGEDARRRLKRQGN